ncbi:MAG: Sensor histidine kinase RcsC [Elusimicrobia bacterium]|nr:Sensor histidine kinase RcsC [Elusimicrobiota bacterium]
MHAFIVDDELVIRRLARRQLAELGWTSLDASSHREAMELFRTGRFNTALIDVNLGEDDGIVLAKLFRDIDPQLTVIVMSGDPTNEGKVKEAGLGRMLAKPFTLEVLKQRLN